MTQQATGRVDEAIESIAELERQAAADVSPHQRWIEDITHAIGRPRTVYVIVAFVAAWIAVNLSLPGLGHRAFDQAPFYWLQGIVSLTGVLLAVLILTTENRTAQIDLRRDRLDLQINLLTERKVAKLIDMMDAMRRDLPQIPTHHDAEVAELRESISPGDVARAIEERSQTRPGEP